MNREEPNEAASEEVSFTPEEIQRFSGYLEHIKKSIWFDTNHFKDYETFLQSYGNADDWQRQAMLRDREVWVEMKSGGERFRQFFEQEVKKTLREKLGSVYHYVEAYSSLGYPQAANFLSNIMNHPSVWHDKDGSTQHTIVSFLENIQSPATIPALLEHINIILSPEYGRPAFISSDLSYCAVALAKITGKEEALALLQDLANKDQTFNGWFKKQELLQLLNLLLDITDPLVFEPFDEALERARLEELKTLPPKRSEPEFNDSDNYSETTRKRNQNKTDNWYIKGKTQGHEIEIKTRDWEKGTLVNFY